ncbi:MAG: hypothetical protein ACLSB9_19565 [Hydrogeniiclostridium mannosilyticum]
MRMSVEWTARATLVADVGAAVYEEKQTHKVQLTLRPDEVFHALKKRDDQDLRPPGCG